MLFKIAWKNIWRNRIRSIVVIIAIAIGLTGGIFSAAVMIGAGESRIKSAIDKETSHIIINDLKYEENSELKYNIDKSEIIQNDLNRNNLVNNYSSRVKINAMISTANAGAGAVIFGINPEDEIKVTGLYKSICDSCGNYLSHEKGNQIIIGKKLSEKLKVKLKSKVVLTFQDINGILTGGAFKVAGIYRSGNTMFDEFNVFVSKKDIQRLLNVDSSFIHEIAIKLEDIDKLNSVSDKLKSNYPLNSVKTWKEIQPEVGMIADYLDIMLIIFLSVILLALGFGIVNTMLMVVLERTKEIGMLMSIGMNKIKIFLMIMIETILLTFTGAIFGIIISTSLIAYFAKTGINLSAYAEGFEAMGYESIIFPEISISFYIQLVILVFLTGVIASIYPALKSLKLKPAEAVRAS